MLNWTLEFWGMLGILLGRGCVLLTRAPFFLTNLYTFSFLFFPYCISYGSSMMLKSSGERGHLCFIPNFSRKASSFSSLSMLLAVGFGVDILYQLRKCSSIPSLPLFFIGPVTSYMSNGRRSRQIITREYFL